MYCNNDNEQKKSVYIKTTYPKLFLYFVVFFGILGSGLIVLALFLENAVAGWLAGGFGLFFLVIFIISIFDLWNNYEVLEGNILTVRRFFRKKTININDLKCIRIGKLSATFYKTHYKVFCRIDLNTVYLGEIIDVLKEQGIKCYDFF